MNCWEFMKCGRQDGGERAEELGVCPAFPNHGKHCSYIAGTLCNGKVQGFFAHKLHDCLSCEFYKSEHFDSKYFENLE